MEKVLYLNTLFRSTTPAWAAAKKSRREGVAIHFGVFLRVKDAECVVRPKNLHRRGGYTHAFRSVAFRVEDGKSDISPADLFMVSAKTVMGAMRALGAEYRRSTARMKAHLARLVQTEADIRLMKEAGVTHPSKSATYRLILRNERRSVQRRHDLWKAAMASPNYAAWVFRSRFFPKFPIAKTFTPQESAPCN